jgi:hypothetical protein
MAAAVMAQAAPVGQAAAVMVQVDQAVQGHQLAVMVQVDQAVQGHQVAVIPRAYPVAVIHQVSPVPDILRVSPRAATQPLPLLPRWEDTQCPMVRFIQAPLEAGLNRFPTFAILALATGTAIGRRALRKWIGRTTMDAGCLVSFGIDTSNSLPAISFLRMGGVGLNLRCTRRPPES